MNHAKILMMSVGAAALSLGFSLHPHPAPFWEPGRVSGPGLVLSKVGETVEEACRL
jgi:hypothetical protein